ncbi:hypothetical protein FXO37_29775 [Capsicum annuum]|nr:hypothetical protein FXO37_29775 [Capsicum annuum]
MSRADSTHVSGQWEAKYEIAELYEQEQNLEQAITYYEKAADLFQNEDVTSSANQCKQKIAEFSAKVENWRQSNLLKDGPRNRKREFPLRTFSGSTTLKLTMYKRQPNALKLPLCPGSGERSHHQSVLYTYAALPCISARDYFQEGLFPRLEPVTSWSHGNNFTGYSKAPLQS